MADITVYNGIQRVIDTSTRETQKHILMHELGHWTSATHLGYGSAIHFIPDQGIFGLVYNDKGILEDNIIISLGGKIAEELVGFQTAGFLLDQAHIFEYMKKMYAQRGRNFPWKRVFEMPYEAYRVYDERCRQILVNAGGKEYLEGLADNLFERRERQLSTG